MVACKDCVIRDSALCASLTLDQLERLNRMSRTRAFKARETISWAGDKSQTFANVMSGVLKLSVTTLNGEEQIVGLIFPGDHLGRLFSITSEYTATALTDGELCQFHRSDFEAVLDDYPALERTLLKRTMMELDACRAWLVQLGRKNAEEKVAGFLVEMVKRLAPACHRPGDKPIQVTVPLTRGQIAELLGLTIETVSRQITRLRASGVIDFPRGYALTVNNLDALEQMAEAA